MSLCCQQDDRRDAVRSIEGLTGLDYVEVGDDQLTLTAVFLGKLPPELKTKLPASQQYLSITGGQRIRGIQIASVTPFVDPDPEKDDFLTVKVDKPGDFSTYTLRLTSVDKVDPRYDHAVFSFKVNCPSDLDCAPACACAPEALDEPSINYLAKDYGSFRQLILDRFAVLMPDWTETHSADIGMMLVEVLAYTGDYLSYYQDAVATEAYLETARQRISVRRHVRLVDYFLSEGCNARAWVAIEVSSDCQLPANTWFITGFNNALSATQTLLKAADLEGIPSQDYEVFEALLPGASAPIPLLAAYNQISFYAWGEKECCIRRGSTSATLLDTWASSPPPAGSTTPASGAPAPAAAANPGRVLSGLAPGTVLIFEEVIGPKTGLPADADPTRRQAVRLTKVTPGVDSVYNDANGRPTPYVDIEWAPVDALQFTFCISAIGPAPACRYVENISVARGNVILVDHGQTQPIETLCQVPTLTTQASCDCANEPGDVQLLPGRVRPTLKKTPLTYCQALPDAPAKGQWTPAASFFTQDVRQALPQVQLTSAPAEPWAVRYDLIESEPDDWNFVVEIDDNGIAHLRFGDGQLAAQPPAGMQLSATYRIGNGTAGNVGAEAISRLIVPDQTLNGISLTVRNPLPAQGGIDAEPIEEAKLFAPTQFRQQIERAITAADYETIAERNPKLQRASAALTWTGSWYEADVAVDPIGSETPGSALLSQVEHYLEPYRRMGHDLAVTAARYVPLLLELKVCALPNYERAHVKAALLDVFSARVLTGGVKGFFHPDNLTFGEGIYTSKIIAAGQAVAGVECITIKAFHRLFELPNFEIENGVLPLNNSEIAQLENDPSFPEHGRLTIQVQGGR